MIQELTKRLVGGERPRREAIEAAVEEIMSGGADPALVGALLTAIELRGVTGEELAAFASVMRKHAVPFKTTKLPVLDTCGTGGDHSGTFNISTAAAFVAAGAGVRVAKHGNRSITSKCGSADVLTALGVKIDAPTEKMEQALDEAGICFLFAPLYHPAMKHVGPIRQALGFRTIFNRLGPLANPAGAMRQVIGVFSPELKLHMAEALVLLGCEHALVVHATDGLDEISLSGPTDAIEIVGRATRQITIRPRDFGFEEASRDQFSGATAEDNARVIREVLEGKEGPAADVVLLNAGAAIFVGGRASSIAYGVSSARESLRSGAALKALEQLVAISNT